MEPQPPGTAAHDRDHFVLDHERNAMRIEQLGLELRNRLDEGTDERHGDRGDPQ